MDNLIISLLLVPENESASPAQFTFFLPPCPITYCTFKKLTHTKKKGINVSSNYTHCSGQIEKLLTMQIKLDCCIPFKTYVNQILGQCSGIIECKSQMICISVQQQEALFFCLKRTQKLMVRWKMPMTSLCAYLILGLQREIHLFVYLGRIFHIIILYALERHPLFLSRIYLKFLFITLEHIVVHIGIINQDALSIFWLLVKRCRVLVVATAFNFL